MFLALGLLLASARLFGEMGALQPAGCARRDPRRDTARADGFRCAGTDLEQLPLPQTGGGAVAVDGLMTLGSPCFCWWPALRSISRRSGGREAGDQCRRRRHRGAVRSRLWRGLVPAAADGDRGRSRPLLFALFMARPCRFRRCRSLPKR